MTSELVGTLTSKYPPLQLVTQDSSASAIYQDVSYGYTQPLAEAYRAIPGIGLVAVPEWGSEQCRYVGHNSYLPAAGNEIAFYDYPENVTVEHPVSIVHPFYKVDTVETYYSAEAEPARNEKQTWETRQAYRDRIESLRNDAEIDGFSVNSKSEQAFWSFVNSVPFARKANLVLLDNGNLRAVWGGEDNRHFGLQFLGEHAVQYVIFRRRAGSRNVSRVAGRDTFVGVKKQVRTFNLQEFLGI
jgi:hypothetical protein